MVFFQERVDDDLSLRPFPDIGGKPLLANFVEVLLGRAKLGESLALTVTDSSDQVPPFLVLKGLGGVLLLQFSPVQVSVLSGMRTF